MKWLKNLCGKKYKFWALVAFFIFFMILGMIFFSYLVHETFHIFHMKGAYAICLPFGLKINDDLQKGYLGMFIHIDIMQYDNIEEYSTLREQSEKMAYIISDSLEVILGLILGILLTCLYFKMKEGE